MAYSRHVPIKAKSVTHELRTGSKYYTYRAGIDREDGGRTWQTHDGRRGLDLNDVREELKAASQAHRYTYQFVLSTRAQDIGADGYQAVLQGQYDQYYIIEHHNTDHPHCHGIGFRDKHFTKAELKTIYTELGERERTAERERTMAEEHMVAEEQQRSLTREPTPSYPSPTRERGADEVELTTEQDPTDSFFER